MQAELGLWPHSATQDSALTRCRAALKTLLTHTRNKEILKQPEGISGLSPCSSASLLPLREHPGGNARSYLWLSPGRCKSADLGICPHPSHGSSMRSPGRPYRTPLPGLPCRLAAVLLKPLWSLPTPSPPLSSAAFTQNNIL